MGSVHHPEGTLESATVGSGHNLLGVKIINVLFLFGSFSETGSDVAEVGLEITV